MRKRQQIQAVIFDVDGVLLDTVPYHFQAWKKAFQKWQIAFTFEDYLQKANGLPRNIAIRNMKNDATDDETTAIAEEKQRIFLQLVAQKPPQPSTGVLPFFTELKKKSFILAAASSSKNAPMLLQKAGLAPYLTTIVHGGDFTQPKPHPEIFLLASKRLDIPPHLCVVIEDAAIGAQAAKHATMKTIGVLSTKDAKLRTIADLTVDSVAQWQIMLAFLQ